jgi:peptidoglycan/xylan/chitin deacetylase (PgdA/CDA1 family)
MTSRTLLPRVLMYHSISRPEDENDALCVFARTVRGPDAPPRATQLARGLYEGVVSGDEHRGRQGLVGLTFDDGYEDFLSSALPTLETLGFSATLFVVAGMLGEENTWEHRGGPGPRLRLLEADGVREVSERGMEIGSHTITHPGSPAWIRKRWPANRRQPPNA